MVKLPHRYMCSFRYLKYSSNYEIGGKIYEFRELEIWVAVKLLKKKVHVFCAGSIYINLVYNHIKGPAKKSTTKRNDRDSKERYPRKNTD